VRSAVVTVQLARKWIYDAVCNRDILTMAPSEFRTVYFRCILFLSVALKYYS
jgi:hypothetical protein